MQEFRHVLILVSPTLSSLREKKHLIAAGGLKYDVAP
jgi:hypothetical protein